MGSQETARGGNVRWIPLDGATNAREVAGFETSDGRTVQPRRLLRSDTLGGLSVSDGRVLLEQFGLTTIIDLRDHDECDLEDPTPFANRPDVDIHRAPLLLRPPTQRRGAVPRSDVLKPRSGEKGRSPYWRYLSERPDSMIKALRVISAADGAALVNCAAGKDRTGLVIAFALAEVGVDSECIVGDYMASASRIEPLLERLAATRTYGSALAHRTVDSYAPKPGHLLNVLESDGGARGWLAAHGWTCNDRAALRSKLLDTDTPHQPSGGPT